MFLPSTILACKVYVKVIFYFHHVFHVFNVHQLEINRETEFSKYFLNVCAVREEGQGTILPSVLTGVGATQ